MRHEDLQVNLDQEDLLRQVNRWLAAADQAAVAELALDEAVPSLPVVFVVGPPRSGTTVTMQWLADSGEFGYPTNVGARFYQAPLLGTMIQRLLTDPEFDFNQELGSAEAHAGQAWVSDIGKTKGWMQPHEYSYFWRRFFPMQAARRLTPHEWETSDRSGFAHGLALLQAAWRRPIALKGILAQYNIEQLADLLPSAIFLHTHRDPFFNAQSLLAARERVYGTREQWFSVEQPGHEAVRSADPITQVVDQVMTTNQVLRQSATAVGPSRWIDQPYESFCQRPATTWEALQELFQAQGRELPRRETVPLKVTNEVRVDAQDEARIREAITVWKAGNEQKDGVTS